MMLRPPRRRGEDCRNSVFREPNRRRIPDRWLSRAAHFSIVAAVLQCLTPATAAREQADAFVAGLRERGLHELALEYLDRMGSSLLADDEFRRRIGYYRGLILMDQARQAPDRDQRAALFGQARIELDAFVRANPESADGAEAMTELANALVDQGKQLVAEAGRLPSGAAYAGKRGEMLGGARRLFEEAIPRFEQAARFYREALDALPKTLDPKTQNAEIERRQEYRGRLAQVSVLAAQAEFEKAGTFARDSTEFRELQERLAEEFSRLHDEYSRWLIGLYARLYEGRCRQALADYQRALGCYEQLIGQSSVHPAFRRLIAAAYGYQAECLIAQGKLDAAIENCTRWLGDARENEAEQPEWLMVRYELAEAKRAKAELRETPASQRRRLLAEARDAFRFVANSPGEFQTAARAAAASLAPDDAPQRTELRDFRAAYEAGKDAMASVNAAKLALPSAEKNNPAAVPELRMQMKHGANEARQQFQAALTLVDDDTDLGQLNEARYFLCWLSWEGGDYYKSAVLGEFLARRYSDHPAAAAAAEIALASYERLQQMAGTASDASDADFEARKMADIAGFIARRWPGTRAAETALRVQVAYAIRHNRVDEAKQLLADVSSAARPALEAQLGSAMWVRYLELSQRGGESPPDGRELAALRREAVSMMERAHDAARESGNMTESAATAGLYLVQAALSEGDYAEAIRRLQEPKFGPLALVESGHPAAARPEYQVEVFKAALRSYVSATPPQAEKAVAMIERLEQAMAASGGSADQLTRVYITLALSLEEQIRALRDAGRDAEARRVGAAFAEFLREISARQDAGDWAVRNWIAQTYYTMGDQERSPDAPELNETSKQYLTTARDAYLSLLADADKDPAFAPSAAAVLAARKQLGECYRQLGEYKQALDTFSKVLAQQEAQLSVQQAAARAYQAWGQAGEAKWLERAIYGGYQVRSTGKNRIWGWLKLAQVAERAGRSNPSYMDVFYEARLEAARCRYLIGMRTHGPDRQRHLATARQSIRSMLQLYPELGGERWRGEFDRLVKQIQQASGEQPAGLKELAVTAP